MVRSLHGPDPAAVGLPAGIGACLFDLDGVLVETAELHDRAWAETFDRFLRARAERDGTAFVPFDPDDDYRRFVDGRIRADGVRTFLASRGIELPEGDPDDPPDDDPATATVNSLGNRKNEALLATIGRDGVEAYPGSVTYLSAVLEAGLAVAVVSASANARAALDASGLASEVTEVVDGVLAARDHLAGKPAPDTFLAGARLLGVEPSAAAVFEDAASGVAAGRAGSFRWVVGVDRGGHAAALRDAGADTVVDDLARLLPA